MSINAWMMTAYGNKLGRNFNNSPMNKAKGRYMPNLQRMKRPSGIKGRKQCWAAKNIAAISHAIQPFFNCNANLGITYPKYVGNSAKAIVKGKRNPTTSAHVGKGRNIISIGAIEFLNIRVARLFIGAIIRGTPMIEELTSHNRSLRTVALENRNKSQ